MRTIRLFMSIYRVLALQKVRFAHLYKHNIKEVNGMSYGKACTNCRHGEYDSNRQDVWCCLIDKWVGMSGHCGDWEDGD